MTIFIVMNQYNGHLHRDCFADLAAAEKSAQDLNAANRDPYNVRWVVEAMRACASVWACGRSARSTGPISRRRSSGALIR